MLVALISDIHDHSTHLLLALARARELGCQHLLCMGDLATISTFRLLCEEWPEGMDVVFGNNEWCRDSFLRVADEYPHATHHGDAAAITLGGREIFFCHYPHVAARAAESGRYDAVFFGHTHRAELHPAHAAPPSIPSIPSHPNQPSQPSQPSQPGTLIVNPGDVQGRWGKPSMAVYDTESNSARLVNL